MVGYLAVDGLGAEARSAVLDKAISMLGTAVDGLVELQASIGAVENRLGDATERLTAQQATLASRIDALEGVDPAEAKVRIDTLTLQIEMSYSLTAKLLQMSILNYA
jgi:flagellar hook-associated protein 3 FlgL